MPSHFQCFIVTCDVTIHDSTLRFSGKTLRYSFISCNTSNYDANSPHENPYNTLRIDLHDILINLTPLFTPTWFSDAFIALFGYPCYILTQCGIYFSTFLFVQATLTLIVKLYKTISIKYNLKQSITLFSSIAHGFFNILTAGMVNDPSHTHRRNTKLALPTSKSHDSFSDTLDPFSDNQTPSTNNTNGITSPPPFYTKRPNKFCLTQLKLFPKRSPVSQPTYPITSAIQHDNYSHQHDNFTTLHEHLLNGSFTKFTSS